MFALREINQIKRSYTLKFWETGKNQLLQTDISTWITNVADPLTTLSPQHVADVDVSLNTCHARHEGPQLPPCHSNLLLTYRKCQQQPQHSLYYPKYVANRCQCPQLATSPSTILNALKSEHLQWPAASSQHVTSVPHQENGFWTCKILGRLW